MKNARLSSFTILAPVRPSAGVLRARNLLEVFRVNAGLVFASVVKDEAGGRLTPEYLVERAMGVKLGSSHANDPVACLVARTAPDPTHIVNFNLAKHNFPNGLHKGASVMLRKLSTAKGA